ncbi:MAG: hypothetical protein K2Y32_00200 [Candidatus Obscuribacterales bacterium]|nr:hypothetical protein [Candidatus Obscuribacterales bacterium]
MSNKTISFRVSAQNAEPLSFEEKLFIENHIAANVSDEQSAQLRELLHQVAECQGTDNDEQDYLDKIDRITYQLLKEALQAAGIEYKWCCDPGVFNTLVVEPYAD